MKKWFILLLVALFTSPAIAERPRLRGPSNPKSRYIIRTNTRYYRNNCNSNRYRRHRKPRRTYRSPYHVVVIVQNRRRSISSYPTRQRVIIKQRHKIIFIGSGSYRPMPRTINRNQIIRESRGKVRSRVYNRYGRKR